MINFKSNILRLFVCMFFYGAFAFASAQSPAGAWIVDKITFRTEGQQEIAREAIMAHMKVRSGMPFEQNALDLSIKSLYDTDLYDAVEARRTLTAAGKLNIEVIVRPKFRLAQVVFKGNKEYKTSRLEEEIVSRAGGVMDERKAKRDADKLEEFYRKRGYAFVSVKYAIERNNENATGAIIFEISEGEDIKIQNIDFVGNEHISSDDLRDQMRTGTWWWLISYLLEMGRLKQEEFYNDIGLLRQYYRNNGYLDVKIDEAKIRFDFPDADSPGDMNIIIEINEGLQYKTGAITFKNSGEGPFSHEKMLACMDLSEGDVFSPALVDSSVAYIQEYYGMFGYLDARVSCLRKPNLDTGAIDLHIEIVEGEKVYLESINIQGNTKTQSEVIIRELALKPGELFYGDKMRESENRLKNTRFFDDVILSDEATKIPNRRNLRAIVREGRTGNIMFGAGFSTVESFVVTAELSQTNFDWLNWRNMFQGAGQKFRIRGSIGLESSQILIGFENPWIFNRRLAYGFELYRTDTGYYSNDYSELHTGMTHYFRKYLFELVEGRLGYTVEDVEIYDVKRWAPSPIISEEGHRSVSKLSLSFLRDTRDNTMLPTSGTRLEFLQQFAGGPLMGQTDIYKVELRAGYWLPVSRNFGAYFSPLKYGDQVFSVVGRTGSVWGYNGEDVPFFERYFLGGAYNLRGFKFRKVGTLDGDSHEPVGGNTFGFLSFEYSWRIIEQFRIAVFYDIGFLNEKSWDWNPSAHGNDGGYNDDFGIGFRILLMGAPMRIDIGMPITSGKDNDDGIQFNFSFGTVF